MYCLERTRTCGTGPRRVRSDVLGFFGESDSADTGATGCPRLDLDHNLGAISAAQLLRCSNRFIGRVRGASTRNFESVSGSGERRRGDLIAAHCCKHVRASKRTTVPLSNLRPFGEAPNGAREARALPRKIRRGRDIVFVPSDR